MSPYSVQCAEYCKEEVLEFPLGDSVLKLI